MVDFWGIPGVLHGLPGPQKPYPFKYHFFVSYTTRESEVKEIYPLIVEFVKELKAAGFTSAPLFFDLFQIGSKNYDDNQLRRELDIAIAESVCMISFVSPGYIESKWCVFEWKTMEKEKSFPLILPLIWKDINWNHAQLQLGLDRLPGSFRTVYPTFMHYLIPPRIKLMSAYYPNYYPIEMHEDNLGIERGLKESYEFINSRTKMRINERP